VIICKPTFAVVRAVADGVVIIEDGLERIKVVFIVRVEDSSGVIDKRVVKLCVVLGEFLTSEVNVKLEMILWSRWVVVINVLKTIFERFKLVKEPLKGDKNLPCCAVTTVFAAFL
jgi:hypothetical protein